MEKIGKDQTTAAIGQLKARLSEYLRLVKAGRDVLVTERGRPIAWIVPVREGAANAGRIRDLVAAGLVREPRRRQQPGLWKRPRPEDPRGRSLEILLEDRSEGW
jgi:prevent-host-death family protein